MVLHSATLQAAGVLGIGYWQLTCLFTFAWNGAELISKRWELWANEIELRSVQQVKTAYNVCIDRFNPTCCEQVFDAYLFDALEGGMKLHGNDWKNTIASRRIRPYEASRPAHLARNRIEFIYLPRA